MHEHICKHELKHCPVCDVVYCEKCGREWGKESIKWYPYTTYPNYPTITWSVDTGTPTAVSHVHS